jgi:TRAP-type C4-dicarboxylate transport system substrate-binding protein
MKNRRFLTLLSIFVLVMVVGVVAFAGCGDEEPAATTAAPTETTAAPTETTGAPPETTAAPTATTAAPTGETIKLKYADQNAPTSWPGIHAATPWLDSIEQATNGQVKIERFFGQTLMTGADTWEGLKAGVSDLAGCMFQYWAGLAPLSEVMTLPFLPFDKGELGAAVLWQLYEEFPSIQAEFKDNHLISMWTSSPFYLLTTKKPVYKPEDMKGLKIRALGGPPTQLVEALGGTPVSMIMPTPIRRSRRVFSTESSPTGSLSTRSGTTKWAST